MFITIAFVTLVLFWTLRYIKIKRSFKSPPYLPGWIPLIGHMHWFLGCNSSNIWNLHDRVYENCGRLGGIAVFSLGLLNVFIVTDPEDAHTIANSSVEKNLGYDIARPWLGNGLLTSNGATWKSRRKVMNLAFTQKILNGLVPVFNLQARRLADDFSKQKETFNPEPLLLRNNLETICMTSLGLNTEKHQDILNEYGHSLKAIFEIMFERFLKLWLHNDIIYYFTFLKKKQDKVISGLHQLSNTLIENRKLIITQSKQEQSSADTFKPILGVILELTMEKGLLTDKELREELDTILFGGHDTSATLLTYIMVLLGSNETIQEKAFREIIDVIGDSPRDVASEDFPKLSYLECIIKESLRLYPIAPMFPRSSMTTVKTRNYTFPPGSSFLIDAWSIHRHPMWGPDAHDFKPERWQNPDTLPHFQKALSGFGVGRRTCIGKPYAMMSLKVVLVHILIRYKLTADISKITLKMNSLLRPESGQVITIEKRK